MAHSFNTINIESRLYERVLFFDSLAKYLAVDSDGQCNSFTNILICTGRSNERPKRTFTPAEKELVFDLWKQGTGFSDISKVLDAAPGTGFTALRQSGGIKPQPRKRNTKHLTLAEREEIRVALSAKMSLRAIARMLNRSPSTISKEVARNSGRRYYKAVDADNRAKRMAKRPKLGTIELNSELKQIILTKLKLKCLSVASLFSLLI